MPAYKDQAKGTWYASFYYENWKGEKEKKLKRGFKTKREALEWERTFQQQKASNLDMVFRSFVEVYSKDMEVRLKQNTWLTKKHIIETKLLPAFGGKKMNDIRPSDIIQWQNEMIAYRDEKGKPYSETYLKTLHNQLSAIFNHAVRFYELKANPAAKAGNMGKAQGKEMLFWTKEEYLKFADAMMDKPLSYYTFEILYWCGIRMGELLALTPADFDFTKRTLTISKSYQRLLGGGCYHRPQDRQEQPGGANAGLPRRGDAGVHNFPLPLPAGPPHFPGDKELSAQGDGQRRKGGGGQADTHPRYSSLARFPADRNGIFRCGDC